MNLIPSEHKLFWPFLLVLWITACERLPSSHFNYGKLDLLQKGTVSIPAKAKVTETVREIPIPKNTKVTLAPDGETRFELLADTKLTEHKTITDLIAATPPAPPTLAQKAEAHGIQIYYYIGAACAVLAAFAFGYGHAKAGIVFTLSAIGVPLLARAGEFIIAHYLLTASLSAGTMLVLAWYFIRNKHVDYLAELKTQIEKETQKLS